jgi:hypothetical protein
MHATEAITPVIVQGGGGPAWKGDTVKSLRGRRRPARYLMVGEIGALAALLILWAMVMPGMTASSSPPILPDPQLTPGATLEVTTSDICVPGYTKKVRSVPAAVKKQVYAAYGIQDHAPGDYEVDHLIPLELGGSNTVKNLWPQSFQTQPWNAHVKDHLENELHRLVCAGELELKTAQHDIATDWIAAYRKYFHTDLPLAHARTRPHTRRPEERP